MKLFVNGKEIEVPASAIEKRIVEFLREDLDLTGVKNACDIGACGACSILINNEPLKICIKRVKDFDGSQILTIEGMAAPDGTLHPLQQAWIDEQVPQCGFCQNGQIMTAKALLDKNPHPTDAQIRAGMQGTLCRCMTYYRIQAAVKRAAKGVA